MTQKKSGGRGKSWRSRQTAEQLAAYEEKKAARKEQLKKIVSAIAEMSDEQKDELVGVMGGIPTCAGHILKITNSCMVLMQLPTATMVGGYNQWRETGRHVKKGEQGLAIWAPTKGKTEESAEPSAADLKEGEKSKPNFIVVYVFDISQTETDAEHEANKDPEEEERKREFNRTCIHTGLPTAECDCM